MYSDCFDTPVGYLTVRADDDCLLSVEFGSTNENTNPNSVTDQAKKELAEYFNGERRSFSVKYKLSGTPFQKKVWAELAKIPYGKTVSYKYIA